MALRILYEDQDIIAVDKPGGLHVHPPEGGVHRIARAVNCLSHLRDQLGYPVFPLHRIDRATSGVVLFARSSESASLFSSLFTSDTNRIIKTYICVVRGFMPEKGLIDKELKNEAGLRQPCFTRYECLETKELPWPVGPYSTSRSSLLKVTPLSGRRHQIRRHMNGLSHPIIGDSIYGDGHHNKLFQNQLKISGLLLKAYSLNFRHPRTGVSTLIQSRWQHCWHQVFDLFGLCPWEHSSH